MSEEAKVVGIRPGIVASSVEVDTESLDVAQQLIDKIKSGQVKAFAWVTVGTGEEAAVTAYRMTPGFCAMPLLGALTYVTQRVVEFIQRVDHD